MRRVYEMVAHARHNKRRKNVLFFESARMYPSKWDGTILYNILMILKIKFSFAYNYIETSRKLAVCGAVFRVCLRTPV